MQPDPRETAQQILDIFREPHIDEGTELEDIHLLEAIADILEEFEKDVLSDTVYLAELVEERTTL